jgi:hypothetical protein
MNNHCVSSHNTKLFVFHCTIAHIHEQTTIYMIHGVYELDCVTSPLYYEYVLRLNMLW